MRLTKLISEADGPVLPGLTLEEIDDVVKSIVWKKVTHMFVNFVAGEVAGNSSACMYNFIRKIENHALFQIGSDARVWRGHSARLFRHVQGLSDTSVLTSLLFEDEQFLTSYQWVKNIYVQRKNPKETKIINKCTGFIARVESSQLLILWVTYKYTYIIF